MVNLKFGYLPGLSPLEYQLILLWQENVSVLEVFFSRFVLITLLSCCSLWWCCWCHGWSMYECVFNRVSIILWSVWQSELSQLNPYISKLFLGWIRQTKRDHLSLSELTNEVHHQRSRGCYTHMLSLRMLSYVQLMDYGVVGVTGVKRWVVGLLVKCCFLKHLLQFFKSSEWNLLHFCEAWPKESRVMPLILVYP